MQYDNYIYFKTKSYTFQFSHVKNDQVIALSNYSQSLQKSRIPPSKLNHASAVVLKNNHRFDLILQSFMLLRVLIILTEKFVFDIWIFIFRGFVAPAIDVPLISIARGESVTSTAFKDPAPKITYQLNLSL